MDLNAVVKVSSFWIPFNTATHELHKFFDLVPLDIELQDIANLKNKLVQYAYHLFKMLHLICETLEHHLTDEISLKERAKV